MELKNTQKKVKKDKSKTSPSLKVKSVVFVPRTPSSKLAKLLRAEEQRLAVTTGYRVKIQERSGTQLRRILCSKSPLPTIPCGRDSCLMCKVDGSGDCRRRNILYHNSCDNCSADNAAKGVESTAANTAAYWGESFRSASERSLEHLQDYRNKKEESHMWRHKLQAHPDEEVSFTMKVVKRFHSSFEREMAESIHIEVNQNNNILNQKLGFNRCLIPRLSVMMGEKEYAERLNREAYDESEFEQLTSDKTKRDKKKKLRDNPDSPDIPNNNSHPLPPPGKRKRFIKPQRQVYTDRVNPEERCRKENAGLETIVLPPCTEELIQDAKAESPVCSEKASTSIPTPPPPPPTSTPAPPPSLTPTSP